VTYVIAQPCAQQKDASCVEVCPTDCIHPTKDEPGYAEAAQLYIDPEGCIDCGACIPECPVEAIFADHDVPAEWAHYTKDNARWFDDSQQ
jgi:NAD-dependent dihydropyrimidine dehydrogenase PreA subunit